MNQISKNFMEPNNPDPSAMKMQIYDTSYPNFSGGDKNDIKGPQ